MRQFLTIGIVLLALIVGCAYPTSGVRVPDERPSIAVKNAPRDAVLYVDGLNMGMARDYDGRSQVLLLEPGTHKVEVSTGGRVLLSETVFLGGGELRTLVVTGQ